MKGLLTKDFLTVKKKYGIARLIMDLAIIAALMIILEGNRFSVPSPSRINSLSRVRRPDALPVCSRTASSGTPAGSVPRP